MQSDAVVTLGRHVGVLGCPCLTITLLGDVRWYPVFNYYQPHSHTSSYTCVGPRDIFAKHQNPRTPWSPGYFQGDRGLSACFRVPQCTEYILQTGEPGAA